MAQNREALRRYSRQIILPEIALAGQERLSASTVLVIGAGGLGAPVLTYLACSGVGRIVVSEFDTLEVSNLQRQFLFDSAQIGAQKLELALQRLHALNPLIAISGVARFAPDNAVGLIAGVDLVIDASDNAATRYLVSDTCALLEKTWVWGAAEGFTGMTAVFDHTLTLRDAFPDPISDDNCDTVGVFAPLLGQVGSQMASAALKLLIGLPVKRGVLTLIDALEGTTRAVKLRRA